MTDIIINIIYAAAGVSGLYFGAALLVKGTAGIALRLGVTPLVVGVTLVACATSAPELVVSVEAAMDGNSNIALGNIIGSNICNIALILGLCGVITPLNVERKLFRFDLPIMAGSALLLAVVCFYRKTINWQFGMIFLLLMTAFTVVTVYLAKRENAPVPDGGNKETSLTKGAILTITGLLMLVAGGKFFLSSAVFAARLFQLSDAVIALTVVAISTSLPEMATSVVAAARGEKDIAVGNVVGSNIFNILGITGISSFFGTLKDYVISTADISMLLLCSFIILPVMRSQWRISRAEGVFLLLLYGGYTWYLIVHHI